MRYYVSLLMAGLVAGCTMDKAAAPDTKSLSDADAQLVGNQVAGEVEDITGEFTIGSLLVPAFPSAGVAPSAGTDPRPAATNCPTITPFPPVDADGDHVPDDVTLSFTLPDCSFTRDGRTFEITGTIHITDPSTTQFGVRTAFADFQHKLTGPDGGFFLTRLNGVRQVLRSAAGFSLIDRASTARRSSPRPGSSISQPTQGRPWTTSAACRAAT